MPAIRFVTAANKTGYPRYEVRSGEPGALGHAIEGIRTAVRNLGGRRDAPVIAIGYARGGGMAVEYTGVATTSPSGSSAQTA